MSIINQWPITRTDLIDPTFHLTNSFNTIVKGRKCSFLLIPTLFKHIYIIIFIKFGFFMSTTKNISLINWYKRFYIFFPVGISLSLMLKMLFLIYSKMISFKKIKKFDWELELRFIYFDSEQFSCITLIQNVTLIYRGKN